VVLWPRGVVHCCAGFEVCARDPDPQECDLGPRNIFHRGLQYKYFLSGPKRSSWVEIATGGGGGVETLQAASVIAPPVARGDSVILAEHDDNDSKITV
jgi:hypothetical protein